MNKEIAVHTLRKQLEKNKANLVQQIQSLQDDLGNETKSSMGDKYETSRAQLHLEIDQLRQRLYSVQNQLDIFNGIDFNKIYTQVEDGAWVETTNGYFLLGIGLGEIKTEEFVFFSISLQSPIGKEMKGKGENEIFSFREKNIQIEKIV